MEAPKETATYVHPSGKVLPVNELAPIVNPLDVLQEVKELHEAVVEAVDKPKAKRAKKS
jgi:hypothetical protein